MRRLRLATVCTPPLAVFATRPSVSVPPFVYLRSLKSDFDAVKGNIAQPNLQNNMREIYPITLSKFNMTFNFCLKLRVTWVRPKHTQFPK